MLPCTSPRRGGISRRRFSTTLRAAIDLPLTLPTVHVTVLDLEYPLGLRCYVRSPFTI
jgi:hypothetical protein